MTPLEQMDELSARLDAWDGSRPAPEELVKGQAAAKAAALAVASHDAERAETRSKRAQAAQASVAACRLQAELARFLACLTADPTDLNGSLYEQVGRGSAMAGRLKTCYERFGRHPAWDDLTIQELPDWLAATPDYRRQIMVTGTELDAALGDPRWAAAADGIAGAPR